MPRPPVTATKMPFEKYQPFLPPPLEDRSWPSARITKAPRWCSVDLRDGNIHLVAGTWLMLYGCALLAASTTTVRLVGWLGGMFVLLGTLALTLPTSVHNLLLGVGFGGLHILFGAYVAWQDGHAR